MKKSWEKVRDVLMLIAAFAAPIMTIFIEKEKCVLWLKNTFGFFGEINYINLLIIVGYVLLLIIFLFLFFMIDIDNELLYFSRRIRGKLRKCNKLKMKEEGIRVEWQIGDVEFNNFVNSFRYYLSREEGLYMMMSNLYLVDKVIKKIKVYCIRHSDKGIEKGVLMRGNKCELCLDNHPIDREKVERIIVNYVKGLCRKEYQKEIKKVRIKNKIDGFITGMWKKSFGIPESFFDRKEIYYELCKRRRDKGGL